LIKELFSVTISPSTSADSRLGNLNDDDGDDDSQFSTNKNNNTNREKKGARPQSSSNSVYNSTYYDHRERKGDAPLYPGVTSSYNENIVFWITKCLLLEKTYNNKDIQINSNMIDKVFTYFLGGQNTNLSCLLKTKDSPAIPERHLFELHDIYDPHFSPDSGCLDGQNISILKKALEIQKKDLGHIVANLFEDEKNGNNNKIRKNYLENEESSTNDTLSSDNSSVNSAQAQSYYTSRINSSFEPNCGMQPSYIPSRSSTSMGTFWRKKSKSYKFIKEKNLHMLELTPWMWRRHPINHYFLTSDLETMQKLFELGYRDAFDHRDEIIEFFTDFDKNININIF
jgi:hypothetical protein